MAIVRAGEAGENNLELQINQGDFRALREIVAKWGFKDEESVLRFALAVLGKSHDQVLYQVDKMGAMVGLEPADSLRHSPTSGAAGGL